MRPFLITNFCPLILLGFVFVAGCWGAGESPSVATQDSGKVAEVPVQKPGEAPAIGSEPVFSGPPRLRREDLPELTEEQKRDAENLVMGACSRCHAPLAPDVLPRDSWEKVILSMSGLTGESGQIGASAEEIAIALYWYESSAPEQLDYSRHQPQERLKFDTVQLTPRGLESERIPAVSDILMLKGKKGRSEGILISELRSRRLMFLPYGDPRQTGLVPYLGNIDFNYPASLSHADFDGKGRMDILVSSIGGMNPTNDVEGGAWIVTRSARDMKAIPVGGEIARACSMEGEDLDGDEDTDFVVCAFGFRGPGRLLWLKNINGKFAIKEIDGRDGFVSAILDDVDGDDDIDIVALLSQEHEILMQYTNTGEGVFEPKVLLSMPNAAWGSSDLLRVDIDRDGDRDLILVNGDTLDDNTPKPTHGVRWVERSGDQYVEVHEITLLPGCERAAVGDLDGDGDLDVVGAAFFPQLPEEQWGRWDSLVWAENLGDAKNWVTHVLEVGNPVHSSVLLDDVNRDGLVDIILGNYVWLPSGGGSSVKRDYLTVMIRQ
ncbi:MAG: FG-GAP-like repeat-containing protein [Planctomycetota bacterium]